MGDEFKDDEYHFSDNDGSPAYEEETTEADTTGEDDKPKLITTSGLSQLRRVALIGIAGFVILLILYKFLGGLFSSDSGEKIKQTPSQTVSQPVEPAPSSAPQPAVVASSQIASPSQPSPEVMSSLKDLQSANQNTLNSFNRLSNEIQTVSQNLSQMSGQMGQLNQNIHLLARQIYEQQMAIKALKAKPKNKHVSMHKMAREKFYIQAVIPGRAWLVSEHGKTMTVAVGDTVPGYGMVKDIKAQDGAIVMSGGHIIHFSPQEM